MARPNAPDRADTDQKERRSHHTRVAGFPLIVLDASIVVELLTNGPLSVPIAHELAQSNEAFAAPHLLDVEVVSAIRGLTLGRQITAHIAGQILTQLAWLPLERYPHTPFLERMWELRQNFTAYDAAYISLAEATGSVLYTCDSKLLSHHRARVRLFTGS